MNQFRWTDRGPHPSVDADVAGAELERIRMSNGGLLRPENVVEAAKAEDNPLHPCFLWDDTEAARLHREQQARRVIRCVRVVVPDRPDRREVAFVSVSGILKGQQGYTSTREAMADPVMRDRILRDAYMQLKSLEKRFGHLRELAAVFEAIHKIVA